MTKKDKNQRFVGFKNVIEIEKIFPKNEFEKKYNPGKK